MDPDALIEAEYGKALDLLAKAEGDAIQRECDRAISLSPWGWIFRWWGCDPPAVEVGD